MQDLWTYLKKTEKPIFIYGTGNGADKIINRLIAREIPIKGVFASNDFVRSRVFRGFEVISAAKALEYGDIIALMSFGSARAEVTDFVKELMKIAEVYAPDVPVAKQEGVFDTAYAKAHKAEIEKAYSLLADEASRKTYENIIKFKLTGNINLLFDCECPMDEMYKILNLHKTETYFDIGAYNGDTVLDFIKHTKVYKKVIAAEPDTRNFKKLTLNTHFLSNIELRNVAVCDFSGEAEFFKGSGRGSALGENGEIIKTICIDDISRDCVPTYIKIDIEGAEALAIKGGERTIKNFSPKLNIAAYHRNEDLFSIPLQISELNPDYKIYLRHHPYIPAWDTNFYMV